MRLPSRTLEITWALALPGAMATVVGVPVLASSPSNLSFSSHHTQRTRGADEADPGFSASFARPVSQPFDMAYPWPLPVMLRQ